MMESLRNFLTGKSRLRSRRRRGEPGGAETRDGVEADPRRPRPARLLDLCPRPRPAGAQRGDPPRIRSGGGRRSGPGDPRECAGARGRG